jgi:hypothetical protein
VVVPIVASNWRRVMGVMGDGVMDWGDLYNLPSRLVRSFVTM